MRRVCLQFNDPRGFLDLPKADVQETVRQLVEDNVYHNSPMTELKVVEVGGYVVSEKVVNDLLDAGLPATGTAVDFFQVIDALKELSISTVGQRCFPVDSEPTALRPGETVLPHSFTLTPNRLEAFAAVNSERDYQDAQRGNAKRHEGASQMTPGELLLCMEKCLADAREAWYKPDGGRGCLDFVRKVTALGVQAMELYGAPLRK